jgi:NADH-quinone oxidoreductase subunit C
MDNQQLLLHVSAILGAEPNASEDQYGMLNLNIEAASLLKLVEGLKNNHQFIYLTDICAAHYPDRTGAEFEVVYHLHNLVANQRVRIKVGLAEASPNIPTLTGLYAGANWMERETFDFYGIQFEGHPDLRRILNMEDMDYHPLRKQYALEDETRTDKNDTFFGR